MAQTAMNLPPCLCSAPCTLRASPTLPYHTVRCVALTAQTSLTYLQRVSPTCRVQCVVLTAQTSLTYLCMAAHTSLTCVTTSGVCAHAAAYHVEPTSQACAHIFAVRPCSPPCKLRASPTLLRRMCTTAQTSHPCLCSTSVQSPVQITSVAHATM